MITNIRKWDLMEGKNSLNSEEACIWYTKKNKKRIILEGGRARKLLKTIKKRKERKEKVQNIERIKNIVSKHI
jgi:hypothetical protein